MAMRTSSALLVTSLVGLVLTSGCQSEPEAGAPPSECTAQGARERDESRKAREMLRPLVAQIADDTKRACETIALALDASAKPKDGSADVKGWCATARGLLAVRTVTVTALRPTCDVPFAPAQACAIACAAASGPCDLKTKPPRCARGKLILSCDGKCAPSGGSVTVGCEGGSCDAACESACGAFTSCDRACRCEGSCKPGVSGSVQCDGTCSVDYEVLSCRGGEIEGLCALFPQLGMSTVGALCDSACGAQAYAVSTCAAAAAKVKVSGAPAPSRFIDEPIGVLLVVAEGRGEHLTKIVDLAQSDPVFCPSARDEAFEDVRAQAHATMSAAQALVSVLDVTRTGY